MARAEATVRLQALDGTWETAGVDRLRGIVPEGIQLSANEWGCDRASFTLRRDPGAIYPDLSAFTPCEVEIGGQVVWSGRIAETPTRDGGDSQISVECEGWQYHLDDTVYQKNYVHTRLTDWQDARSFPTVSFTSHPTGYEIETGGVIKIAVPPNTTAAGSSQGRVVLDTGEAEGAKRVVVTYVGGGHASLLLELINGTTPDAIDEGPTVDAAPIATSSTTFAHTFTTARRYVSLRIVATGAFTGDTTSWARIEAVKVFRDAAYESGNASILKADTVAKDARAQSAPLLSTSNDRVEAQTFSIPEFSMDSHRTPREVLAAVNAYEDCLVGVDVHKRLYFRDKPTTPLFEIGNWTGAEMEDASANSGDEIYTQAIIEGTGPDGQKLAISRTQTAATLVSRRGFTRTKILAVSAAGTTASYNQIGDLYLAGHRTTPMRGRAKATGPTAVRKVLGGETVHPAKLLIHTGELLRLSHRIDPDTGGQGRDARIASVAYSHDGESAEVELDSRRGNFEALLERLAIVTGQI